MERKGILETDEKRGEILLELDVNLGPKGMKKITVYEGDIALELAVKFGEEHGLDESSVEKLEEIIKIQINGLSIKIDEDKGRELLMYIDVNLGLSGMKRITVYQGDTAPELAVRFGDEHGLDESAVKKLEETIKSQMNNLA
jgi:hypothetical protein